MLKVYAGKTISGLPQVLDYANVPVVQFVNTINEADYLLIPHNWTHVDRNVEFVKQYIHSDKKTIIFWFGDSINPVILPPTMATSFPNAIIFRTSEYKSKMEHNEIIMPTVVEDLGTKYGFESRLKGDRPIVGFVGWAGQKGLAKIKSAMKNIFKSGPYKKGLYFRKLAIDILSRSPLVRTNFVLKDQYKSGSQEDYVANIKNTDFTLAPKGDGNYSARFYETLSLGRLPILIDTECVLPLENEINYDEFIVRVPYQDIARTTEYVIKFYHDMSNDEYKSKQAHAREVFEKYLRIDKYLARVLTNEFLSRYV